MKNIHPTTRRKILTAGGIGALAALLTARVSLANHHLGDGGNDALKKKCKRLQKALNRARRNGNRAAAKRLKNKLKKCRRRLANA